MAWIESHQEVGRHPKTRKLARRLDVSIPTGIGHLHLLWHWAMDFAQDGEVGAFEPWEIADASMWEGDPDLFIRALVETGFLDSDEDGLRLHDWEDYAGKLIQRRREDAERKRQSRRRAEIQQTRTGQTQMSDGRPPDVTRMSVVTVPNPTVPNPTGDNFHDMPNRTAPTNVGNDDSEPADPTQDRLVFETWTDPDDEVGILATEAPRNEKEIPRAEPSKSKNARKKHVYPASFETLWKAYPKTGGSKDRAMQEWRKLGFDEADLPMLLSAIDAWKASRRWQEGYVRDCERWLRDGLWKEPPPPASASPAKPTARAHATNPDTFGEDLMRRKQAATDLLNGYLAAESPARSSFRSTESTERAANGSHVIDIAGRLMP